MTTNSDKETNSAAGVLRTVDRPRFDLKRTVKLVVGEGNDKQTFFVHPDLLTAASPFFRNALQGGWKETEEQCITLPVDSPLVVNTYLHFLYTGDMNIDSVRAEKPEDTMARTEERMLAVRLYTFAEKIQDTQAKNKAVIAMYKSVYKIWNGGTWFFPAPKVINCLYENTLPGCFLRKMIVDVLVYSGQTELLPPRVQVNSEFFFDVAAASIKLHANLRSSGITEEEIEQYLEEEL